MASLLSAEKQLEIAETWQRLQSVTLTAKELGLSRDAIYKYRFAKGASPQKSADPIVMAKDRADRLRALSIERQLLAEVGGERSFREFLHNLINDVIKPLDAPPPFKPLKPTKGTVHESLVLHLSDWHAYEIVNPKAVFGLNEYDGQIIQKRVDRIINTTADIKARLEDGGYRFSTLVIPCNGDFVSGTIHEVEKHLDGGKNIVTAIESTGMMLAGAIRQLASLFDRVFCFGTSGNHGRLPDAKKVQTKEPTRSWDYLVYTIAKIALANCQNVQFERPDSWATMFELEGKLFYQGHGHFIKSWNSIPFYGITRMTSKLGAILAKHCKPVDYWLFGHFHTQGSIENAGGEYLINPCLIGPQEFGIHSFGDATPPGQMLFGVHNRHGITHRWRLSAADIWPTPAAADIAFSVPGSETKAGRMSK